MTSSIDIVFDTDFVELRHMRRDFVDVELLMDEMRAIRETMSPELE